MKRRAIVAAMLLLGGAAQASGYTLRVGDPEAMRILPSDAGGIPVHASGVFYCRRLDLRELRAGEAPESRATVRVLNGEVWLSLSCKRSSKNKAFRLGISGRSEEVSSKRMSQLLIEGREIPFNLRFQAGHGHRRTKSSLWGLNCHRLSCGFDAETGIVVVYQAASSLPEFQFAAPRSVLEYIDFSKELGRLQLALRERRPLPEKLMPVKLIELSAVGTEIREEIERAIAHGDLDDLNQLATILTPAGLLDHRSSLAELLEPARRKMQKIASRANRAFDKARGLDQKRFYRMFIEEMAREGIDGHPVVKRLIEDAEQHIRAKYLKNTTPLFRATAAANIKDVAELLESGADPNTVSGGYLYPTPWASACASGNKALVATFLSYGVKINSDIPTRMGATCIHFAAEKGDKKVVTLLLHVGGEINTRDWMGKTPIDYSKDSGMRRFLTGEGAAIGNPLSAKQMIGFLMAAGAYRIGKEAVGSVKESFRGMPPAASTTVKFFDLEVTPGRYALRIEGVRGQGTATYPEKIRLVSKGKLDSNGSFDATLPPGSWRLILSYEDVVVYRSRRFEVEEGCSLFELEIYPSHIKGHCFSRW